MRPISSSFGDLSTSRGYTDGCSNNLRGIFGGGDPGPGVSNVIDFITIESAGNAVDFGDLTVGRTEIASSSNGDGGLN